MEDLLSILSHFKEKEILVIGDVMLDTYFKGDVSRISAEAPIPIVSVEKEFHSLGGAGNVAANVVSLGGKATLFSFVGKDSQSEIVKKLLKESQIKSFLDNNHKTTQKIRIMGGNQQLSRADFETTDDKLFTEGVKISLIERAKKSDIIIISDYAKGAITSDLMNLLLPFKKKIICDPKPKNKDLYKGIFLLKANEKESTEMTALSNISLAGKKLKEELNANNVLITRGKNGMTIFSDSLDKEINIPTSVKEVFDVTGAGDTAIAAIALAVASGASLNEAAIIANHAAGIKVEKAGTYAVSLSELSSKLVKEESKILDLERLHKTVLDLKKKGKKIVWTNGCFDLLHVGHTYYLKEAKKLGDVLIVGLNSDDSVRKLKGPMRPINTEEERAEILSSLEFVDYILIFPETSVERYLTLLKPDVFVKGGDYSIDYLLSIPEGQAVKEYSGEIKIISLVEGKSTTKILENIKIKA